MRRKVGCTVIKKSNVNVLEASSRKDKWMYSTSAIGANATWMLVSSFLTIYYTNCVALSPLFVGNMMLVWRVFDGVSDIVAGSLID